MTQTMTPPEKPLNLNLKQLMLQNLRRTDIYIINEDDPANSFYSSSVKNFRDETLIKYDFKKAQIPQTMTFMGEVVAGTHTITFMGEVIAEMNLQGDMNLSKQHKDILGIGKKIKTKSEKLRAAFEAG